MKHRDFIIEKLKLTTPEERKEIRAHDLKVTMILAVVIVVAIVAVELCFQTYWNSIPHCIDGINAARVCK